MTTNDAERTALRERLARIARHAPNPYMNKDHQPISKCWFDIADAILVEFPEIGQQPRIDPATKARSDLFMSIKGDGTEDDIHLDFYPDDSIAPAAQQLPTRSDLANVLDAGRTKKWDHFVGALIAAGYAREDEPDPEVGEVVTLRQRTPEEREFYMIAKYAELERRVRDLESKFSPPPDKAVAERDDGS